MCYYARTDYDCGDWKWGNMKLRCPRQHRIGETCGAKLVHAESVTYPHTVCKVCEELNTKKRRLAKTYDNIQRWSREPDKFSASLDKAKREAGELNDKICELERRRPSVVTNLSAVARPQMSGPPSLPGSTLPPIATMTGNQTYGYASPQISRRQEMMTSSLPRHSPMAMTMSTEGKRTQLTPGTMGGYGSLTATSQVENPYANRQIVYSLPKH